MSLDTRAAWPPESHYRFANSFARSLPADPERPNRRRQVWHAAYSRVEPTPVRAPRLVGWSEEVAAQLGLERAQLGDELLALVLGGNALFEGMEPIAACYGGHQFGNWAGQLGDGRAITLGEVLHDSGRRLEMQIKGGGPTPYSRSADGRAVLRSSIREFVCSEAMHHLGVPTTRALSLVTTGESVLRDMFYDGNPRQEPGAIVCRVAPSFVRFGNFELFAARDELDLLRQLADYTIATHFGALELGPPYGPAAYLAWFEEVCRRTAVMVAHWMRVGFVHGVMNTDNMSILGLTIDYGPYGWLEPFDPGWTPNTTDAHGRRYRFGYQPQIALWNLAQLGSALFPLVDDIEALQERLNTYSGTFAATNQRMMAQKLGFDAWRPGDDDVLYEDLRACFRDTETDMTLFFRNLAEVARHGPEASAMEDEALLGPLRSAFYDEPSAREHRLALTSWLRRYLGRLGTESTPAPLVTARMNAANPLYVPRNYLAQVVIDAAEQGDFAPLERWCEVLRDPYREQPGQEQWAARRPEWARERAGCSMLSCSS